MLHKEKNEIKYVTYIMKHNKTCLAATGEEKRSCICLKPQGEYKESELNYLK